MEKKVYLYTYVVLQEIQLWQLWYKYVVYDIQLWYLVFYRYIA